MQALSFTVFSYTNEDGAPRSRLSLALTWEMMVSNVLQQ